MSRAFGTISHDRGDESLQAKTAWFKSLSMGERIDIFCELYDLVASVNPEVVRKKDARSIPGRVRVLEQP